MSESNKPSCPYPKCGCVGYGYVPVQEMFMMIVQGLCKVRYSLNLI